MKKTSILIRFLLLSVVFLVQPTQAADHTNSIGVEFKNIPAGSFYMGSCKLSVADKADDKKRQFMGLSAKGVACPSGTSNDNDANDDETPQHEIHITKGFQIGVYEITLGQFKKFIAGAGRDDLLTDNFIKHNNNGNSAAVSYVSWDDAQAFIRWLNKNESGNHYRLPTEAEWEYAARAGTNSIYSWGNSSNQADSYAWYDINAKNIGENYAHAVGEKQPNPWGLYDMQGNIWEWVQDLYDANYYRNSPTNDPVNTSSEEMKPSSDNVLLRALSNGRILRGGSAFNNAGFLRPASRGAGAVLPFLRGGVLGFRLVRQP